MVDIKTSPDLPFVIRGGDSKETALYNRIAAINRINFLVQQTVPHFEAREKSSQYLKAHDLEMWKRFYEGKEQPVISEDFCQKAAQVFVEMEGISPSVVELKYATDLTKAIDKYATPEVKKATLTDKLVGWLNKNKVKL
jgi:hypothetical protein